MILDDKAVSELSDELVALGWRGNKTMLNDALVEHSWGSAIRVFKDLVKIKSGTKLDVAIDQMASRYPVATFDSSWDGFSLSLNSSTVPGCAQFNAKLTGGLPVQLRYKYREDDGFTEDRFPFD